MSSTKKAAEIKEIKDLCATIIMSVSGEVVMNQDGTWKGFTGTNYIDEALSVAHAPWLLDRKIKEIKDMLQVLIDKTADL